MTFTITLLVPLALLLTSVSAFHLPQTHKSFITATTTAGKHHHRQQHQTLPSFICHDDSGSTRPLRHRHHRRRRQLRTLLSVSKNDYDPTTTPPSLPSPSRQLSRRDWITLLNSAAAAAAASTHHPLRADAAADDGATLTLLTPPPTTATSSSSLCNPSVSSWKRNNRVVHILGTAHISADSAEVAGRLVKETRPQGVFVELDAKRVGRAFSPEKGERVADTAGVAAGFVGAGGEVAPGSGGGGGGESPRVEVTRAERGSGDGAVGGSKRSGWSLNPFQWFQKAGSVLVGDALRGLYKNLESQGFSAGEEFVVAVREGLNIGSVIILGDRDVDVTLDRLTTALRKTDFKKLLAADSEFERSIQDKLPDELKQSMAAYPNGNPSSAAEAQQLSLFVETLKAKDTVRQIMAELKEVAPELHTALVAERDEYMANGIDSLNQYESMVAVMGMAHVDGVESYLRRMGWELIKPAASCSLS